MAHNRSISVIGLGYVGLPVAVAFARNGGQVVAFDINQGRINELKRGFDRTGEVDESELSLGGLHLTDDPVALARADFHIVTVPTPITSANRPDLRPVLAASRTVGRALKKGSIVVFESTVYPGVTEEECVPILEAESGLKCGPDFTVGYSPERINPGDKVNRLETITKVVSGQDAKTLDIVADVYESIITAGVHRAPNIKTAEAAKVIENTQRDINIALMNELAVIFNRLDIDTRDVLAASGTKWNFLSFTPGLVGGHCIGVDPYYLTHRAEQVGYHPEIILAGRRTNDDMGAFVAKETVKHLINNGINDKPKVAVLGLTFKENVPDVRNSKSFDVARELESFGVEVVVSDPHADADEVRHEYGLDLRALDDLGPVDGVILAVAHDAYLKQGWPLIERLLGHKGQFVADLHAILSRAACPANINLWRL